MKRGKCRKATKGARPPRRRRWQTKSDGEGASAAEEKWLDGMKWKSRRERSYFFINLDKSFLMTSFVNSVDTFPRGEGKKNSDISSFFLKWTAFAAKTKIDFIFLQPLLYFFIAKTFNFCHKANITCLATGDCV